MKVTVPGKTPLERLTEFTRRIVAVPKAEALAAEKKSQSRKRSRKKR
jgi:hypothetical protein